jgi:hypothetical protein
MVNPLIVSLNAEAIQLAIECEAEFALADEAEVREALEG